MESLPNRNNIHSFVESLAPGTRVVWVPDGTPGTIQNDKSILWDDGRCLTRKEMTDSHALLIFSNAEKKRIHEARAYRAKCLKGGCKLERWSSTECNEQVLEHCCPMAVLPDTEADKDLPRRRKARPVRTKQAIPA